MIFDLKPWGWFQDVEFFFHHGGTGGRAGDNPAPNWFFYWSQIKSAVAGKNNPSFDFRPARAGEAESFHGVSSETPPFKVTGTVIVIHPKDADSLSGYVGILGHEQKHEDDFWNVIWSEAGYKAEEDTDHDGLRDAWETTQYGNLDKDLDYYYETDTAHFAWSDDRADIAAKDAVNADLGIDAQDWSDRVVPVRQEHSFEDDNPPPPPAPSHKQTCQPTTSGNNKGF